ncbi:hypothetical protein [Marinobacter suaedae]
MLDGNNVRHGLCKNLGLSNQPYGLWSGVLSF